MTARERKKAFREIIHAALLRNFKEMQVFIPEFALEMADEERVIDLIEGVGAYRILFDHNFAKAFWGEGVATPSERQWQHHLQKMVLENDPIEYAYKFVDES